jgi:hypothetical protein
MRGVLFSTMVMAGLLSFVFAGSADAAAVTATGCLAKGDGKNEFKLTNATGVARYSSCRKNTSRGSWACPQKSARVARAGAFLCQLQFACGRPMALGRARHAMATVSLII